MDTREALKILNLKHGVSLEDAKSAYRELAKKFHPDLAGDDPGLQENAEARMKDINLAFRLIVPELKSSKEKDELKSQFKKQETAQAEVSSEDTKASKNEVKSEFSWFAIFEDFGHFLKKKRVPKSVKRNLRTKKKAPNKVGRRNSTKNFKEVFNQVHPEGSFKNRKKKSHASKRPHVSSSAYSSYKKYMDLKRKMKKHKTARSQDMSVGRVQRIQPVTPVEGVRK